MHTHFRSPCSHVHFSAIPCFPSDFGTLTIATVTRSCRRGQHSPSGIAVQTGVSASYSELHLKATPCRVIAVLTRNGRRARSRSYSSSPQVHFTSANTGLASSPTTPSDDDFPPLGDRCREQLVRGEVAHRPALIAAASDRLFPPAKRRRLYQQPRSPIPETSCSTGRTKHPANAPAFDTAPFGNPDIRR